MESAGGLADWNLVPLPALQPQPEPRWADGPLTCQALLGTLLHCSLPLMEHTGRRWHGRPRHDTLQGLGPAWLILRAGPLARWGLWLPEGCLASWVKEIPHIGEHPFLGALVNSGLSGIPEHPSQPSVGHSLPQSFGEFDSILSPSFF